MKKNFKHVFLLTTLLGLLISSCRKENSTQAPGQTKNVTLEKVTAWLDAQQQKFTSVASRTSIANLKNALIGSQLTTVALNDKQTLVIIPLKDEFKTMNGASQHSLKSLVITENNDHALTLSNIIEIVPQDQRYDKGSAALISKIYSNKDNDLTGTFRFLSLSNKLIETREYNGGKLTLMGSMPKNKVTASTSASVTSEDDEEETDDYEEYDPNAGDYSAIYDLHDIMSDDSYGGIMYYFHAQVTRIVATREVTSVVQDPVGVYPLSSTYTDYWGRTVHRQLVVDNQNNNFSIVGTSVTLNWACTVYGSYVYSDNTTGYWYWNVSKTAID